MNPWIGAALVAGGVWLAASIPFALYAGHLLKQLGEVQLSEVELDGVDTENDTH